MTAVSFVKMLRKNILPAVKQHHGQRGRIIMDNDSKHRAKHTESQLTQDGVPFSFIPPLSPDLNPIEKVWARLDATISQTPQNH